MHPTRWRWGLLKCSLFSYISRYLHSCMLKQQGKFCNRQQTETSEQTSTGIEQGGTQTFVLGESDLKANIFRIGEE